MVSEPAVRLQVLAIFDLTRADLSRFAAYERAVLPVLEHHRGRLELAVRAKGGAVEVHLLQFDTKEDFESFRASPKRLALSQRFIQSGASEVPSSGRSGRARTSAATWQGPEVCHRTRVRSTAGP